MLEVLVMKPNAPTDKNQGEGDKVSAREYNQAAREFVADGKVEDAARDAATFVEAEPEEAKRAEAAGRRGPKGTKVSVDDIVDMGRTVIERVRPYVARAVDRVKSKLNG